MKKKKKKKENYNIQNGKMTYEISQKRFKLDKYTIDIIISKSNDECIYLHL